MHNRTIDVSCTFNFWKSLVAHWCSVSSTKDTCTVHKLFYQYCDYIICSKDLPSRKYCWWNEPKPMGGAPGPVTCCMFRLKKQNKKIFIMFDKCYLVTHRQILLNKLTTPDSAHIADVLVLVTWLWIENLVTVLNSCCQLVDDWLRDCNHWLYQITDQLSTVYPNSTAKSAHTLQQTAKNSFSLDVESVGSHFSHKKKKITDNLNFILSIPHG